MAAQAGIWGTAGRAGMQLSLQPQVAEAAERAVLLAFQVAALDLVAQALAVLLAAKEALAALTVQQVPQESTARAVAGYLQYLPIVAEAAGRLGGRRPEPWSR